jgi:oligopeptide transport system substrate-binding protein
MTPNTRHLRAAGAGLAGVVLLSACSGAATEQANAQQPVSLAIGEPVTSLVPGNTTEEYGAQILESLWTGLVQYGPDGEVEYTGVAQSIDSEDSVTWTVRLHDDWTFHDGTPVSAESFVDAWNYTAYSPNAQSGSYFFANVAGYGDLQAPVDENGEPAGDPAATEMTGLQVVDDATFTVTLSAPFAQFPVTLGYNPFFPLPQSFYDDPEAFGRAPIGNGAFRADGEFRPEEGLTVRAYDEYAGDDVPSVEARRCQRHGAGGLRGSVRGDAGLRLHVPRPTALRGALRRPARPPGVLDGDRPPGDRQGDLLRYPAGGRLGRPSGGGGAP